MKFCSKYVIFSLFVTTQTIIGYDQPLLDIGLTNILDGGPVRPTYGWYFYEYIQYYKVDKLTNAQGHALGNLPAPKSKSWYGITELVYQTQQDILFNAQAGFDIALPYAFSSFISPQ